MIFSNNEERSRRPRATGLKTALILTMSGMLSVTACDPGELLNVETPDIIDPTDVESAAGANAVRIGALARFTQATTGSESLMLLGALFSDEFINGDTFTDRHGIDQRIVHPNNTFLTTASRNLHRARLSANQAARLVDEYVPDAPGWQIAEMHFIEAYMVNQAGENFCNGVVFSDVEDGVLTYGEPMTTQAAFERALTHVQQGISVLGGGSSAADARVRDALRITHGRILMNLDRPADALQAVSGVPTEYEYNMFHSINAFSNHVWNWNNSTRRYSVGDGEGGNGLNFASADDPRVPVCVAPCAGTPQSTRDDAQVPLVIQTLWPAQASTIPLIQGVDARMLEAEALLRAGDAPGALGVLNAARATVGLDPLEDAGSADARIDQLFREKAFWTFARGYRMGDLRRLVRQYSRAQNTVFPTGSWHKGGAAYGNETNFPVPAAESNNPNVGDDTCLNRDA